MTEDRALWYALWRALLSMAAAIDKRHGFSKTRKEAVAREAR
jgi:hypothetical protein